VSKTGDSDSFATGGLLHFPWYLSCGALHPEAASQAEKLKTPGDTKQGIAPTACNAVEKNQQNSNQRERRRSIGIRDPDNDKARATS